MQTKDIISDFKMLLLVGIIVSIITFEIAIIRIYGFINPASNLTFILSLFTIGTLICSFGHVYIILRLRNTVSNIGNVKLGLKNVLPYIIVLQILVVSFMMVLLYQVLIQLSYSLSLISSIFLISYLFGIINLIFISWKFTKWTITKPNYVLAVNTLAVFTIMVNVIFALLMVVDGLPYQPSSIPWDMGPVHYSYKSIFLLPYQISSIIAFVGIWIAITVLMKNYSNRIGMKKFWIFISIPMIYFLTQFQPYLLNFIITHTQSDASTVAVVYTSIFGASKTIGAILFGYAFWNTSKKIHQTKVKRFMRMAAYGLTLLFISNQATSILNYLFPPSGIHAVSFLGIASYMFLVGLFSSALSVANDLQIRQAVRKSVENEFALVSNMGDAEMENIIKNKIVGSTKRLSHELVNETGIESTLSDSEILEYTIKAIKEVKSTRQTSKN